MVVFYESTKVIINSNIVHSKKYLDFGRKFSKGMNNLKGCNS